MCYFNHLNYFTGQRNSNRPHSQTQGTSGLCRTKMDCNLPATKCYKELWCRHFPTEWNILDSFSAAVSEFQAEYQTERYGIEKRIIDAKSVSRVWQHVKRDFLECNSSTSIKSAGHNKVKFTGLWASDKYFQTVHFILPRPIWKIPVTYWKRMPAITR